MKIYNPNTFQKLGFDIILSETAKKAISEASKSVRNIKSAYVQSQSVVVNEGNVTEFRVNLKVSFEVN